MSVAPIRHAVVVALPPERAFAVFAGEIGAWWPRAMSIGRSPQASVTIEPRAGGAWFETGADGAVSPWGRVLAWEPPARLLLAWQIDAGWTYREALVTEVELTFTPRAEGGTEVVLEHRLLERLGADGAAQIEMMRNGWPRPLAAFAAHTQRE